MSAKKKPQPVKPQPITWPAAIQLSASPDWIVTPCETVEYTLTLWVDSVTEQDIYLTRKEFILLKRELGRLRGLKTLPAFDDEDIEATRQA